MILKIWIGPNSMSPYYKLACKVRNVSHL